MYLKSVHKQADHEIDVEIFLKIIKTKKKKMFGHIFVISLNLYWECNERERERDIKLNKISKKKSNYQTQNWEILNYIVENNILLLNGWMC